MTKFSGAFTLQAQMQNAAAGTWARRPGAPTIGTASVTNATTASVTFTAPTDLGFGAVTYIATSTPGSVVGTSATSPISVSGLTTGTSYTFTVTASTPGGSGPASAASNSITMIIQGQQEFTTAGTFSWVAPAGVTSVSVVAVGAGGGTLSSCGYTGGGGGLGYKNNITVVPGNSYTVNVTATLSTNTTPCYSYFISQATVGGQGGRPFNAGTGGGFVGDGGGNGGGNPQGYGGGGAGGYSGNGGNSSYWYFGAPCCGIPAVAVIGNGAGGGGGGGSTNAFGGGGQGGGGGGVGLLGQGASGAGGSAAASGRTCGGCGGSGGARGGNASGYSSGAGGAYGGGAGRFCGCGTRRSGGGGAVRIIWPGTTRQFPSTNTGNV